MIEDCSDLLQCENRLSEEVCKVSFLLGDIALSEEDLDHLGTLISQRISSETSEGTRFLRRKAPTCLACFLVWMGIVGYRDGDYWSAVRESAGLVEDPNWEQKWGRIFLDFLETNNLPRFEIEGDLTYVTPILTHGGIPNSCLNEYFEKVLLPMVQRDLKDPADPKEALHELALLREDNRERIGVEQQHSGFQKRVHSLAKEARRARRVVETYGEVVSLWQAETAAKALDLPTELPADYEAFKTRKCEEIRCLEEKIRDLKGKQARCEQMLARFTEQDKQVLAQAEAIERSISEHPVLKEQQRTLSALATEEGKLTSQLSSQSTHTFSEPWDNEHGELLTRLSLDRLREPITRFEDIVSRQDRVQRALDHLRASSGASSWMWPILVSTLLLLGLMLVVIGVQVLPSWVLTIIGIGFTIIAGFIGWSWHRKTTGKRRRLQALEQTLTETISERGKVRGNITRMLGDLPIAQQQLRSPSPALHQALVSLADAYQELCEIRNRRVQLRRRIRQ